MNRLFGSTIRQRMIYISLIMVLGLAGLCLITANELRKSLIEDHKIKTRQLVEVAHGVVSLSHARLAAGTLSEAEAKAEALRAVKALRYEKTEYFWINDLGAPVPKMVMHPTVPALDGKVLDSKNFDKATSMQPGIDGKIVELENKNLFVSFNAVVNQAGHGFVRYMWPKPKAGGGVTEELFPKLSYVKKFEPWGWVIGSGIYIDHVNQDFRDQAMFFGAVAFCLLLIMGAAVWAISWSILRQLGGEPATVVEAVKEVAAGDLSAVIHLKSGDETSLLSIIKGMASRLADVITDVHHAADEINNAVGQVTTTAQTLSQASSEQAAALERTTSSMEQMTASINQNTENARLTDKVASKSSVEAAEGGAAVRETVEAMKSIAGKIGIIDDIAYQTNLLALNAAIEAARAGEHGKGFAVVAAEVRKLAERSQVAAQEIGRLADSSVKTAEHAGQLLDAMVPSIKKTSDLVQEIAAASEEQSAGVGQINGAMGKLNRATQQNAAASEELAATAGEIGGQATQLVEIMAYFRVDQRDIGASKR